MNETNSDNKFFLFIFTNVFNGRNYISKLLDSLLKQKCNNFIHYIYNDGSTDNIDDIVNKYITLANARKHPFKVYYEKNNVNKGSLYSTQHCIKMSKRFEKCNYVGWINCDDWVDCDFISSINQIIEKGIKSDLIIVNTSCCKLINNKYIKISNTFDNFKVNEIKKYPFQMFLTGNFPYGYFIFNKDFYFKTNKNNYLNLYPLCKSYYNDVQIYFTLLGNNPKISLIEKSNINFYIRDDAISITTGVFEFKKTNSLKCLENSSKYIKHSLYENILSTYKTLNIIPYIKSKKFNVKKRDVLQMCKLHKKHKIKNICKPLKTKEKIKIILYIIMPRFILRIVIKLKRKLI